MGASGSIDYLTVSGTYYASVGTLFSLPLGGASPGRASQDYSIVTSSITTTVTQELTVKYYQRVYDAGTAGYCYYTKTSIDPTPLSTETSPEYTGEISDHSVVKILEIY